jgi:hypothetical protein
MAELTSKKRDKLQPKQFGLPEERAYPMPDASHAANAKARATQQEKKGNLSHTDAERIRRKANKVLG